MRGQGTILFLDEVHRFNKSQQDALLPSVESGLLILIGATTENPFFEVNPPLLSRSTLFRLEPLSSSACEELVLRGLASEGATIDDDALTLLVERANGDGRHVLTSLEVAVALAREHPEAVRDSAGAIVDGAVRVTVDDVEAALGTKALRYGRDDHYDVVSAFIKSIRGSDPDAGLYWLARMLEAGEDARFIARRLVILASEDIGMAEPSVLQTAVAAAQAVAMVGMPEASIILAHATIHAALAPKSNAVVVGIGEAMADVRAGGMGRVPAHLRDAHYPGAKPLGHGAGYAYPHDLPTGVAAQQYLPDELAGHVYYRPTRHGAEAAWADVHEKVRRLREGEGQAGDR